MGFYVNLNSEKKEVFLAREGMEVPKADWENIPKDSVPVILINNGYFTAAGIGYDKKEYLVFTNSTDLRPKKSSLLRNLS